MKGDIPRQCTITGCKAGEKDTTQVQDSVFNQCDRKLRQIIKLYAHQAANKQIYETERILHVHVHTQEVLHRD